MTSSPDNVKIDVAGGESQEEVTSLGQDQLPPEEEEPAGSRSTSNRVTFSEEQLNAALKVLREDSEEASEQKLVGPSFEANSWDSYATRFSAERRVFLWRSHCHTSEAVIPKV